RGSGPQQPEDADDAASDSGREVPLGVRRTDERVHRRVGRAANGRKPASPAAVFRTHARCATSKKQVLRELIGPRPECDLRPARPHPLGGGHLRPGPSGGAADRAGARSGVHLLPEAAPQPAGMRYMVVDCGGGTVDITVHELSERSGTLRELHKATGGPWGSMGVDAEFERLLGDVFGEELVAQFKAKRPASYTELMVSWEARKRSASPHRDSPLSVFPPFSFIDFFRKTKGKEIEQAVRKYGRKEVTWSSQGALRLQPSVMRELFQPTIHKILRYIQDVLDSPRVHGIQYLFLVGGFAESQLLQHEVRTAFSTRVRVVIPQGVALTTLRGAVLFGLEPGVVTVRRSKHTYGVGVLKRFQPGVHPEEKLVERDGVQWCADVLDKFVSAEQSVALGEAVVRRYTPALPAQSSILINIYCADSDEAQNYSTDGAPKT
ncbi:Heat shock 70 kDa protein 12A, partial [Gryllus bimaculatus]